MQDLIGRYFVHESRINGFASGLPMRAVTVMQRDYPSFLFIISQLVDYISCSCVSQRFASKVIVIIKSAIIRHWSYNASDRVIVFVRRSIMAGYLKKINLLDAVSKYVQ